MNIEPLWLNSRSAETAAWPLAESRALPVETLAHPERASLASGYCQAMTTNGGAEVNDPKNDKAPPPTLSAPPEKDLEKQLKRNPTDADLKADVGSDESMDASDPPAVAQGGCSDEPAPSSGFPE
jgi:hypothetical protein